MRDFKNMKRQRGRNRSGGGSSVGGGGGGGGKTQHNANRAFDSNGPENVKIRGHAQHVFEKYQQLARDAFSSGDRVVAENYLQHADHYFRVLRTLQPQRSPSEILGRDSLASGLDIDFEEEFEQAEDVAEAVQEQGADTGGIGGAGEQPRMDARFDRNEGRRDAYEYRDSRQEREPRRDGGDTGYRDRNDNRDRQPQAQPQRERYESRDRSDGRDAQPRENQGRDYQGRDYQGREAQNRDGQPRDGQTRENQGREGQYRDGQQRDGSGQAREGQRDGQPREGQDRFESRRDGRRFEPRREDRSTNREPREGRYGEAADSRTGVDAESASALPGLTPQVATQPFPPSAPEGEASPVLRSEDGGMSDAPAFLQAAAPEDGETRKPRARRRRAPRSFEAPDGGEGSPVEPEDA